MDLASLPPALKPIIPYLKQSQQLEKHDLLMAYYCRVHAIQMAMDIKQKMGASGSFLSIPIVKILDQGDADKAKLGSRLDEEDEAKYVEAFAMKAFSFADTQDRAGKANKATSTTFYSAFLFFNVLEHMGEVSEEVKLKKKYASWRSVDINTAIKNGVTPSPPPSIDQNEEGGASGETEEDAQLKQLERELNLAKETLQQDNNNYNNNNNMSSSTIITTNSVSEGMSSSLSFPSFPSIPNNNNNNNNNNTTPSFPSFPSFPSPPTTTTNSDSAPSFPKFPSTPSPTNSSNNSQQPSFPSFPSFTSPTNSNNNNNNNNSQQPSFPTFQNSTNQKRQVFESDEEEEQEEVEDYSEKQQQKSTSPSFPKFPSHNNEYNQPPPAYEFKQSPPQQHKQSPPQQQQQHHNIHDNEALIKYQQQVAQQNLTIQKQKHQNQMLQDEVEQKQQQIQLQQQQLQQQQQQIQQLQKQIQQQQKQLMSGGGGGGNMSINLNHTPSDTDKASAEKYSKWVISSLQFDDVPSAVKNAKLSLKYLTGEDS
ncbi:hypothetical protein ACTFIW_011171 [Dictyostelium discoideum]